MRLKQLREASGLTQAQVAASIGIKRSTYKNYEIGFRPLPIDLLIVLAELYNVTTDYVLEYNVRFAKTS